MSLIRPFAAWLPAPEHAAAVASPPLGELTTEQWFAHSHDNPLSFLHVVRTEIDTEAGAAPSTSPTSGRSRLHEMISEGVMVAPSERAYYVYRLEDGHHATTGLVAEVHVSGYADGRIKRHEHTRASTEELLVGHLRRVGAHSDPVGLTHIDDDRLAGIVAGVCREQPPHAAFVTPGGQRHTVWVIDDPATIDDIQDRLDRLPALYITDGHHRCAATLRYAEERAIADADHEGSEDYHYLLAALFPQSELRILGFNRCVGDLGMSPDAIVETVGRLVRLETDRVEAAALQPGEVAMVTGGRRYRCVLPPPRTGGVFGNLDVVRLQEAVLGPAFGIVDPRMDHRLRYVAGGKPAVPAEHGCEVCFVMHPTSIRDVMHIADQGEVMPPKSTWFEPKVWGGLFVALLQDE